MILVDDHKKWTPDWPLFHALSRDSSDPRPLLLEPGPDHDRPTFRPQ
jgi:hypothetical protein